MLSLLHRIKAGICVFPLLVAQAAPAQTPAPPKADATNPAAPTPVPAEKPDPGARSFLPRAGSNARPSAPSPNASNNPFKPHSVEMLRQANRLKVKGFDPGIMNDGEVALAINAAINLLAKVDDDYLGHRTKAIQDAEEALKQIKTKAGKAGLKARTPPHAAKAGMTQQESDDILREARKAFEKVVLHINRGGNIKNMGAAKASVQKAIRELATALESR